MNDIIEYKKTENIVDDICNLIDGARTLAYQAVDATLTMRNWLIGKRIDAEVLSGKDRAEYGAEIIGKLSKELTDKFGSGYSRRALYQYLSVYRKFPQIVNAVSTQSDSGDIVHAVSTKSGLLSWTHYRILLQVEDREARLWYEKEAYNQTWSTRTLQRNISSQYYYRMLKTQDKLAVDTEMKQLTSQYQNKLEFIKNPVIAEFLGMQ